MARLSKTEAEYVAQGNVMTTNMNPGILGQIGVNSTSWNAAVASFTGFKTSIDLTEAAKSAYLSASAGKKAANADSRSKLQVVVDKLYATPSITDENLRDLGLPPRNTGGGVSAPVTVTDLSATPNQDGTCKLKWKRNGNSRSTLFEIQSQDGTVWRVINSSTVLSFTDPAAPAGFSKSYRVVSVNARGRSVPSGVVTIYSGEGNGSLRIAA